jgi:hypothetical protein
MVKKCTAGVLFVCSASKVFEYMCVYQRIAYKCEEADTALTIVISYLWCGVIHLTPLEFLFWGYAASCNIPISRGVVSVTPIHHLSREPLPSALWSARHCSLACISSL